MDGLAEALRNFLGKGMESLPYLRQNFPPEVVAEVLRMHGITEDAGPKPETPPSGDCNETSIWQG